MVKLVILWYRCITTLFICIFMYSSDDIEIWNGKDISDKPSIYRIHSTDKFQRAFDIRYIARRCTPLY